MRIQNVQLKPLHDQVMVITGASSGIGLATAKLAARHGAKVVLFSRDQLALEDVVHEIEDSEGEAIAVEGDVASDDDLNRLVTEAVSRFGRIDCWVNNAGVSIYGRILDTDERDAKRLFETNFWGVVRGSKIAIEQFERQSSASDGHGFCLINIGSVVGDRAIPMQGVYSASKFAVKGFTEALRMEVEKEKLPISITLVKPGSIDTPYPDHAKNLTAKEATLPPPVYDPILVAKAVCHCAQHPRRDVIVGGGGRLISGAAGMPRATDKAMEAMLFKEQFTGQRIDAADPRASEDTLFEHGSGGSERGRYAGHTRKSSMYTAAELHPGTAALIGAGVAAVALLGIGLGSRSSRRAVRQGAQKAGETGRRLADRGRDAAERGMELAGVKASSSKERLSTTREQTRAPVFDPERATRVEPKPMTRSGF